MDDHLNRRISEYRFEDIPNDAVNLLLDERLVHSLDKVNNGRQKEAVFLDRDERMPTGTITSNYPVRYVGIWYFLSAKEEEMPAILRNMNTYH